MNIQIISHEKWTLNSKLYLYCYMTKIISSQIMQTCQVKASSHFPLHSTLHSYTAEVLSMEQICSRSVASSFKFFCRKQRATDVHTVLFWGFTLQGRFRTKHNLCFLRHQTLSFKIQTWASELQCCLCQLQRNCLGSRESFQNYPSLYTIFRESQNKHIFSHFGGKWVESICFSCLHIFLI